MRWEVIGLRWEVVGGSALARMRGRCIIWLKVGETHPDPPVIREGERLEVIICLLSHVLLRHVLLGGVLRPP